MLGISTSNLRVGGFRGKGNDADAVALYSRIIADGGVSNLSRLNYFVVGLKTIYGTLANVPVCYDAHWIGYKLGSGTGATAGQAVAKLYTISVIQTVSDSDAQAFIYRVYNAGGELTNTEANAVNQLTIDMKSAGIWTAMKAVYPMVGASAAACAQNLKSSSFTGTFNGGWTYASTGVTPNGTNAYFDTNLIPGTNMSASSASLGFVTNIANNQNGIEMGVQSSTEGMSLWTQFSSNNVSRVGRGNDANTGLSYTLAGRFYGSRTTPTLQTLYRNGVSVVTGVGAVSGLDSVYKITLGGLNLSGVPALFANGRYSFAFIGDGLSGTNITNLDSAIVTFNTTLSR